MGRARDNGGVTPQCGADPLQNQYHEGEGVWEVGQWEGVDDRRMQRRDGEVIIDDFHQGKYMCGEGHLRERRLAEGKTYTYNLMIRVNEAGERKDSIAGSRDLHTCLVVRFYSK